MAPHSSTLAWKIPWAEEPDGLQSVGSVRVGHDWATSLSLFTFMHWRRKWQPTPVFLPGESQGRGSLVGCCLWGRTRLSDLEAAAADLGWQWGAFSHWVRGQLTKDSSGAQIPCILCCSILDDNFSEIKLGSTPPNEFKLLTKLLKVEQNDPWNVAVSYNIIANTLESEMLHKSDDV